MVLFTSCTGVVGIATMKVNHHYGTQGRSSGEGTSGSTGRTVPPCLKRLPPGTPSHHMPVHRALSFLVINYP